MRFIEKFESRTLIILHFKLIVLETLSGNISLRMWNMRKVIAKIDQLDNYHTYIPHIPFNYL